MQDATTENDSRPNQGLPRPPLRYPYNNADGPAEAACGGKKSPVSRERTVDEYLLDMIEKLDLRARQLQRFRQTLSMTTLNQPASVLECLKE